MSIVVKDHLFTLHTKNTSYQLTADDHGILRHLYYGAKAENADFSYLVQQRDRGFSGNPDDAGDDRTLSFDTLPLEYPVLGCGDYREACLAVTHPDGSRALDLRFEAYRVLPGKPRLTGLPASIPDENTETLEIQLCDRISGLCVWLSYALFSEKDVITRSVRIENGGSMPVTLDRVLSCCLDLYQPAERDLMTFYGRHAGERNMQRSPLQHGKFRVESIRGASSLHYNPSTILCAHDAAERSGEAYAAVLVYSGSFLISAELDQIDQTRLVAGIQPEGFSWQLCPGEVFTAPEVLLSYSAAGLGQLSRQLHSFLNNHIIHGVWAKRRRPVLLNSWEAAYFDYDDEKLLQIAQHAAALGIELFVLDDGWFGKRNGDTSSLGDWYVNKEKIKCGLPELCRRVNALGMEFGIWIEPEMISIDSDLYRAHPDWMLAAPNRAPVKSRCQYVLDFSRREIVDYLFERFSALLSSCNISYVKWDMNRSLAETWSAALPAERQGEVSHRYMLGVYALLQRLTDRFPNILWETCSGGGGRFDAGMLYYSPQIWCSDNTDPLCRLSIQRGTSYIYPPSCVGAHVSASPNHQTGRCTPLALRAAVAASGGFGYELDPGKLSETDKREISAQIQDYRQNGMLYAFGTLYRLESARGHAWMRIAEDGNRAIVSYVQTGAEANAPVQYLKLQGLEPEKNYRIQPSGMVYSGAALMYGGFPLPELRGDYPMVRLLLEAVE